MNWLLLVKSLALRLLLLLLLQWGTWFDVWFYNNVINLEVID